MKLILVLALVVVYVYSSYVTQSTLEDCVVGEEGMDCKGKKVVIGLAVTYGMESDLELFDINEVGNAGDATALEHGVKVKIKKTAPKLHYPLVHFHTVAYFPYEEVIPVKNSMIGVQSCIDSPTAKNPTCGWTYQGSYKIEHSQGFCCNKDLELVTDTDRWRGEEVLKRSSSAIDSFSTGHCLRLGEVLFHGYEIETYRKYFEIEVTFETKGDNAYSHSFTLSPADPIYSTYHDTAYDSQNKFNMKGELVGDFAAYTAAPELDNYILYVPASPADDPMVKDYQKNLLLVPREETVIDGSGCDRVGVSFYQFRLQQGVCANSAAGDCLHNQLAHKHNKDLSTLIKNPHAETQYLVHGKKIFKGSMGFQAGMEKTLVYQVNEIQNSLVYIMVEEAGIRLLETESKGIIVYAQVKPFTSMSKDGTLEVKISNEGVIRTDYIVTVTNCVGNNILHAIPAQARTLDVGENDKMTFELYTQYNIDTTNECDVYLKSPTGKQYDMTTVIFDTLKHQSKFSWELQQQNEGSQTGDDKAFGLSKCECSFFDIPCKFIKMCWVDIIIMVVIVLAIIAAVIAVIVFFLAGGGNYLPAIMCYFCKTFGCCMKMVACFTKFFVKETVKVGKGAVKEAVRVGKAAERSRHHHSHSRSRSHKKKSKKKKSKKKKKQKKKKKTQKYDDEVKNVDVPFNTDCLSEQEIKEYCESGQVCYMNINGDTELGSEMQTVMKEAMPLEIGDRFCLVGTIRFKRGNYQFIVHEDLLQQTCYWNGDVFENCSSIEETGRIPDKYRGYSLQLEHLLNSISAKPMDGHTVINQPLEL